MSELITFKKLLKSDHFFKLQSKMLEMFLLGHNVVWSLLPN